MKILLINPPVPESYYNREFYAPLGLLYLGAVLQKNSDSDEVNILDLRTLKLEDSKDFNNFYGNIIVDNILKFKPELIGFGCLYSGNYPDILKFSTLCKSRFENIPIVLGGIHPTIYAEKILQNCSSIDYIILGEAEESIVRFVNTFKNKEFNFNEIDGFAYRKDSKVIVNQKTHFIEKLDTIPFPAYNLLDLENYYVDTSDWDNPKKLPINTSLPIITSRSCPNRCPFCSMYLVMGPKWRSRSPQNVVDEIEFLYNKYKHRHFSFMDDNLTLKKSHILEICNQIIKRNLNIQFETPNGLAILTLDKEVIDALVNAGMVRTCLAIESGSDYIRNEIMGKHLSRKKILEVISLIKKYKHLYVKAFFIIGMPEETKETLMETYNMIKEIDVDRIYLHNIVPFPGTVVFKQAVRDNLLVDINPEDFYKSDVLYITNYDRFFIKPYKLELSDLREFRKKCESLLLKTKNVK